jgi:hypothetical protein
VVALPEGGVVVAGDALGASDRSFRAQRAKVPAGGPADQRSIQVARLAPDGTPLWERAFGGVRWDVARGLTSTGDGGLVVVGSTMSKGPGKTNVWILRLDGEGRLRWDRAFGSALAQ